MRYRLACFAVIACLVFVGLSPTLFRYATAAPGDAAAPAAEEPDAPTRWEYRLINLDRVVEGFAGDAKRTAVEKAYNDLGTDGWRFRHLEGTTAIFEREARKRAE